MENKIEVVINGEIIPIKSSNSVEYLQRLAHYTGKKIDEVTERYSTIMIGERAKSYLLALNIADDYFKVEPELKKITSEHKRLQKEHIEVQDENIKLTERIHSLEREAAQLRAEIKELEESASEPNKIVSLILPDGRKAIV